MSRLEIPLSADLAIGPTGKKFETVASSNLTEDDLLFLQLLPFQTPANLDDSSGNATNVELNSSLTQLKTRLTGADFTASAVSDPPGILTFDDFDSFLVAEDFTNTPDEDDVDLVQIKSNFDKIVNALTLADINAAAFAAALAGTELTELALVFQGLLHVKDGTTVYVTLNSSQIELAIPYKSLTSLTSPVSVLPLILNSSSETLTELKDEEGQSVDGRIVSAVDDLSLPNIVFDYVATKTSVVLQVLAPAGSDPGVKFEHETGSVFADFDPSAKTSLQDPQNPSLNIWFYALSWKDLETKSGRIQYYIERGDPSSKKAGEIKRAAATLAVTVSNNVWVINNARIDTTQLQLQVGTSYLFQGIPSSHPMLVLDGAKEIASGWDQERTGDHVFTPDAPGTFSLFCTEHGNMGGENNVIISPQ